MKQLWIWMIVILLLITGCAQPRKNNNTHLSQIENDLASGIAVVLDYVSDGSRTIVIVDVDNSRGDFVDLWFVQENKTLGQRTLSAKRFYTGNSVLEQRTFRVPVAQPGISETIYVEVFDVKGTLLFRTEPIINSKEG